MDPLLTALGAVLLVIALGAALRAGGVMPESAWPPIDRLNYFALFPALLFNELARADLSSSSALALGASLVGAQLVLLLVATVLRRPLGVSGPAHTSVVQGLVRWNSYVALALVPPLFGPEAMPLAAIGLGAMTPTANLVSVLVLARHGGAGSQGPILFPLLRNPLILGCLAGLAWNVLGPPLPAVVVAALGNLGRSALALGLLTVGAGLRPIPLAASSLPLLVTSVGKLLAMPALAAAFAWSFGLEGAGLGIVVLFASVPTSGAAVILARIMGGDAELMAAIVTVTTLLAFLTMPLVLLLGR